MKLFGYEIRKTQNSREDLSSGSPASSNPWYYSPYMTVGQLLANSTVSACVNIIADAVASLACNVYQKTDNGRRRADEVNLAYLLRKAPNYDDTPFTFKQKIMLHLLLKGNAFIFIERNADYTPRSLEALDPDAVTIKRDADGDVYYIYNCNGMNYKYNTKHILHIPAIRYNSLKGISPLEYASHSARTGLELEEYTSKYFDGGMHNKLLVTVPQDAKNWTKEDSEALANKMLASYGGSDNANKPVILSKGLTAQPLNISGNHDSQLVENRAFSEKEIAKIFRVPMYMLGSENSKFTNMEQANTYFLQQTLTPWIVRLQEYLNRLLSYPYNDYYVEFDTNTLMRADYNTRWNNYRENFKNGIFTLNNICDLENLPRVDSSIGDKHYMQLNMSTLDNITKENNNGEQDNGK